MARPKKKINPDEFYTVYNWMPVALGLNGTKLLVYACIYAYSTNKEGKGCYFRGHEAMSDATGCSTRQITRTIQTLLKDGVIEAKTAVLENGLTRSYYRVATEPLEGKVIEYSNRVAEELKVIRGFDDNWNDLKRLSKNVKEIKEKEFSEDVKIVF